MPKRAMQSSGMQKNEPEENGAFTSLEFRNLLRDSSTEISGLRRFCKACKRREAAENGTYDVVKAYITTSPECSELFGLLEKGKRTVQELSAIFECILNVLLRTAADLKDAFPNAGYTICNLFLQHHTHKLYQCLEVSYKNKIIALTLRLLTAMVMQGKDTAGLVASQVDFNLQCFKRILKPDKKEKAAHKHFVRVAYIRLVLSFFMSGDAKTSQKVLEVQGFTSCIFKGLIDDPASLIKLFLTTIRDKVVKNMSIAKTAKIRLFSEPGVLLSTARLFDWDGVMDIELTDDSAYTEAKEFIHQMAYDFLYHTCCPFKYGINFKDKALGTSGRSRNHILLRFINNLPSVSTATLAHDLVVRILESCPDLLSSYMANMQNSMAEPGPTERWLGLCDLVKNIYNAQPDIAPAAIAQSKNQSAIKQNADDIQSLVDMTIPGIFPHVMSQSFQKRCFKHKSWQVREKVMEMLQLALTKASSTFDFIGNPTHWTKSSKRPFDNETYLAALKGTMAETCLNISLMVHIWSDYCKCEDGDGLRCKRLATQVLCRYHELFPEYMPQKSFDAVKLLFTIGRTTDDHTEIDRSSDDDVTLSILQLFSKHPEKYKWFKMVEGGKTPFLQVLSIICQARSSESQIVHSEAVRLLKKILATNNILVDHASLEADIWLEHLPPLKDGDGKALAVMAYLQRCCGALVRQPFKYTSAITSLQSSEETMQVDDEPSTLTLSKEWWESLPDIEIEALPASQMMIAEKPTDLCHSARNVQPMPVSLMTAASLLNLQSSKLSLEEKKSIDGYLAEVFCNLFHSLRSASDAACFARLFSEGDGSQCLDSDFPMLKNFAEFISLWTGKADAVWNAGTPQGPDIQNNIQQWFWNAYHKPGVCTGIFDQSQIGYLKDLISSVNLHAPSIQWKQHSSTRLLHDVTAQLLLYFDTLISTRHDKTGIAAVEVTNGLHFLLQEIFTTVGQCSSSSVSLENGSNKPAPSEQIALSFLNRVVSLFFENPSIKDLFFAMDNTSSQDANRLSDIVHTTSTATVEVMERVFHTYPNCYRDMFENYFVRLQASVVEMLKYLAGEDNGSEQSARKNDLILCSFKSLSLYLPSLNVVDILAELGNLLSLSYNKKAVPIFREVLLECLGSLTRSDRLAVVQLGCKAWTSICTFLITSYPKKLYHKLFPILAAFYQTFPDVAVMAPESIVDFCCKNIDYGSMQVLYIILQQNPTLARYSCETLVMKNSKTLFQDILLDEKRRLDFIPVLASLLGFSKFIEQDVHDSLYESVLATFYPMDRHSQKSKMVHFLQLVSLFESQDFLLNILPLLKKAKGKDRLDDFVAFVLSTECSGPLDAKLAIMRAVGTISDAEVKHNEADIHIEVVYVCMCHSLVAVPKGKDLDKTESFNAALSTLTNAVRELAPASFDAAAGRISSMWGNFLKKLLKYQFGNPHALQAIAQLLDVIYTEEGTTRYAKDKGDNCIQVADMKGLLVSHSEFVPIMLAEELPVDKKMLGPEKSVKTCLTKLYYKLCLRCDAVHLTESDVRILLGAYHCTLSFSDQNILKTLVVFEQKGVLHDHLKPYLWGEKAALSFRAVKNLGDGLWKKPNPNQVLTCIDTSIMDRTLRWFPIRRRMVHVRDEATDEYFENDPHFTMTPAGDGHGDSNVETQIVYDPCFFLPIILDLLKPEHLVDPQLFLRTGALSFLFACLASHCPSVRSLSVATLSRFYRHCESAWFPEKNLTLYLIHAVKNSLSVRKGDPDSATVTRIPSSVANFLASVVKLSQTPENHMYAALHRFLLVKPRLDLKVVPEFFVLFFSADMEYKIERSWILNLVVNGIRDMGDFHAVNVRNTFQLLMSFHDSPLCDNFSRRQVFEVFEAACMVRGVAFHLTKMNGLISWLTVAACAQPSSGEVEAFTSFDPDKRQDNTLHILNVVFYLWKTVNLEISPQESLPETNSSTHCSTTQDGMVEQENKSDAGSSDNEVASDQADEEEDEAEDLDGKTNGISERVLTPSRSKRATVLPFRIVKQIIGLSFRLLKNLLQTAPRDLSSIHKAVATIASCVRDVKRRQSKRLKIADELDLGPEPDLLQWEVEILLETALYLEEGAIDEVVKTRLSLMEVLSAWGPGPKNASYSKLAGRCIKWCLSKPLKLYLSETGSEENLLVVMHWVKAWLPVLSTDETMCVRRQLLRCYGDICEAMGSYGSRSVKLMECVGIMNNIVMNRQHEGHVAGGHHFSIETLIDMNRIRLHH